MLFTISILYVIGISARQILGMSLDSMRFKPSPLPYANSALLKFGDALLLRTCGDSTVKCNEEMTQDKFTCARNSCCWDEENKTCTRPNIKILRDGKKTDEPAPDACVKPTMRRRKRSTHLNYVGFVVDDTGSMANEIAGVRLWLDNCVNSVTAVCGSAPSGGWLLQTFNDPAIGVPFGPTTSAVDMDAEIAVLFAHGGGDCPERAFAGILSALDQIPADNANCKIFFFTDATPSDPSLAGDAMNAIIAKGCAFIPILTGCCGACASPPVTMGKRRRRRSTQNYISNTGAALLDDEMCPGPGCKKRDGSDPLEYLYYELAAASGGEVYFLDKPSSPEAYTADLESTITTLGFCPTDIMVTNADGSCMSKDQCTDGGHCFDESTQTCFRN